MKKLKIKRKGFGFELVLEGEIKIDESKIKPYEQYYKEKTEELLSKQIYEYLQTLCPTAQEPDPDSILYGMWQTRCGAQSAIKELSDHLAKTVEAE